MESFIFIPLCFSFIIVTCLLLGEIERIKDDRFFLFFVLTLVVVSLFLWTLVDFMLILPKPWRDNSWSCVVPIVVYLLLWAWAGYCFFYKIPKDVSPFDECQSTFKEILFSKAVKIITISLKIFLFCLCAYVMIFVAMLLGAIYLFILNSENLLIMAALISVVIIFLFRAVTAFLFRVSAYAVTFVVILLGAIYLYVLHRGSLLAMIALIGVVMIFLFRVFSASV